MNLRSYLFLCGTALLLFNAGCQQNPTESTTETKASSISGIVLDEGNKPLALARVIDLGTLAKEDTTKTDGSYKLQLQLASNYNTSVLAILSGYMSDTQKVSLSPGDNLTAINIHMKVQDSSKIVSGSSGPAASIILVKQTANTIALWGTGPNVTSTLTFKVVDSTGTPVVGINRSMVNFVLSGGPGAGEFLRPAAALTDAIGEVSTTVTSGTKPGVLQVIASTRGDSVKTSPVFLVAGRGLPDSAGVSIAATKLNIAGRIFSNLSTSILLFVGDRFGNPVADGTSITFVSNGGIIMPSATTKDGVASVDLKSGGANAPPGGLVTVSASTTGDKSYRLSDSLITRQMHILFSGPTQPPILDTNALNLTIPNGGIRYFSFIVADDYGNPLVEGSTVTVSVKALDTLQNDLELLNNTKTFKDVLSHGETRISVGVHDKGNVSLAGIITFGIEIKSTNGDYSNGNWFQGYVAGGGAGTGTFNVPAKIELVDSIRSLYLAETNLSETSKTLTFVVKDALNNPINAASKTLVAFSFLSQPSGTTLSKTQDSTSSTGTVKVKINSGNTWGTAIVVATAIGETGLISATSLPIKVARGLPDSTRIFLELDKKNMFNKTGAPLGTLSVNLIDKDGFPAAPQNDLRANTTGGYVNPPSETENGKTSLILNGGSPEPNDPSPGFGNILLYVPVHGGVTVTKSQPFLFSYEPQIDFTKPSIIDSAANTLRTSLADGGSVDVAFAVWDKNRNPISSGSSIKVTVSGPAVQELELSGDIDLKTTDTQVPLDAIHHFTIKNKSGGGKGDFVATITVTGESGTSTRILNGYALPPVAAEKIALASEPLRILNVRGSGSNETSTLTFQVTNLTNNPIDGNNAVNVDLSVLDVLGGVTISPTRILTDGFGKAVVTLTSGNRYGTVRVVASFTDGSTTISSPQEVFNITGPAMNNFALQISKNNLPGVGTSNPAIGTVTATVADSIGGSLPVGTRVNFRTLNGGAVTSTALTDANGVAIANIKGGTIPNDPVRGMGFGTIQAWMVGNNGDTLKKSIPFLLSGPPATIYFTDAAGSPSTPLSTPIADGGSAYVYFKVRDINWRPVSSDYAITVAVEGDSGAIDVKNITTIRDIVNMSDTSQICSFQLIDKIKGGGTSGPIKVKITVLNKDLGSNEIIIPGTLAPPAGAISTRAAEINFVTSSTSPVYVQNTGLPSATTLTFALIDSNNHPVTLLKADNVLFSILNGTGQEWLSSTDTLSDANGQVTTTFHTGTKSGTFTVMAQLKNTPTIKASKDVTIVGGFPDPNKFTLQWAVTPPDTLLNLPGFVLNSVLANVNILALDKYSNPAKPSVIQFDETSGGSVGAVTTDATGRASASLSGGKPYPNEPSIGSEYGLVGRNRGFGFGFVKARTITENGTFLRDSVKFLFTGAPIITTSADSVGSVIINDGGSKDFSFTISDIFGKAIATIPSNALKVTLNGAGPGFGSLSLESDIPNNAQLPTNEVFPLTFHFKITDNTPNGVSGNFQITVGVDGPLGHKEKIINGTLLPGISSYASSIQLLSGSPSASTISVKGSGATETSTMSFVVKDSSGNPVGLAKAATVTFSIVGGPGGGEFVSPTSAVTDVNGLVSTTINSGTKSGVVIVIAKIGTTIQSSPVTVTIAGGLPDQNRLTVWTDKVNYPGLLGKGGTLGTVSVQVGDLYGNPVQPSSVYFSATGGGVSPANITTDATGSGQVNILGGNPSPAGGFDTITVATNGVGGVTVSKKVGVVFSGAPLVRVDSTNLGTISVGSSLVVNYAVADANRNPIASSNAIGVTVGGTAGAQAQLSGDISITTTDTKDTNTTKYQITVANNVPQGGTGGSFTVTITVNGPNGTTTKILTGTLATPPAIVSGYASSVSLLSASTTSLAVDGSGGTQTATLTYVVKDSLDNPVTFPSRAAIVLFSLSDTTGGARVSPISAKTNTSGQAITVVTAGSVAKVVQVIARVQGTSVYSTPTSLVISGGQPDANHLALVLSRKNYPGLVKSGSIGTVTVQAGDVNGNPVAENTPLSFATTAGLIDPSASTAKGSATVNIYGGLGQSIPVDAIRGTGYGTITVSGIGVGGVKVSKSIPVLFSGAPATITFDPTKVTGNALNAPLAQKGSVTINFTIADANNRTLSSDNKISGEQSGDAAGELVITGENSLAFGDDTTLVTHQLTITHKGGNGGAFSVTLKCDGESGTLTKTITGTVDAPPAIVSGYASSIQLLAGSPSASTISVKGTGATETSTMSFVVKDSLGNPVSATRQATVAFSIVGGPGGGEFVLPTSAITDADGKVTTTINAGTKAGVVQVIATIGSITSSPVTVTIAGGLPDQNHLTVWTDKVNYPGLLGKGGTLGTVSVQVGDLYGNPVQPSSVYFSATGGGVSPANITTDATGSGQVNILGGNPSPAGGFDTITVATNGVGGVTVSKKVGVVFSGAPLVRVDSTNLGTISVGSSLVVNYAVADANRNPIASSNAIGVTVGGTAGAQAQLSGDISITTTDTKDTNTTKYQITVANNVPQGGTGGSFTVTITVNGPNGTTTKILTGALASPLGTITAPTQIILSSVSNSIIAASGTGGLSTSNLTFQALDAGGRAIGSTQSDTVFFSLSDTAGGAHLIPTWAMSDANGQASTKLNAGTKYGVLLVTARLKTISSQQVPVRISGPSWTNFNVTISANNLPGLSQIGTIVGKLNAQIGDTLGNPVLAGTLIKFTTSGGMVDASAATDVNGSADINISGGATPNEPSLGGIGWGYVTAQTQGNSGTTLQKRVPFLFSGAPIITTVNVPSNDTLILLDAGFSDIDYKISDGNGNPLAAGNAVKVTVSGADAPEIALSNYVDFSTDGTTDINQTIYRVRVADKLPSSGTGGYFDVSIKVSGPNGISIRQFHGYLRAPGAITPPSPTAKMPAQIAFVSVSSTDIYVAGTGSTETSAITYEVRDSLGTLIDTHPRAFAQFTLQFFPNTTTNTGSQPRLIPNADSTDDNARLHVSVASGTQAGVVQVYAKIDLGGGKIVTSQPVKISVHAGFADQRHFTLAPKNFNFGGLEYAFWKNDLVVQVVDKYSNPVLPGTAVYFNTMHGAVGTGKSGLNTVGVTDVDGFINQNLWSSNPFPEFADTINLGPGFSWVYARTLGESATWVVDSSLIVWTGQPIVSNLAGPATYTIANGGSEGPWTFTIADKYGHPMSSGTKITVTGPGLSVDGDGASLIMPDIGPDQKTFIVPTGAGITDFTIVVSDGDPGNVAAPPIKSLLTITIDHPVYGRFARVIASGTVQ